MLQLNNTPSRKSRIDLDQTYCRFILIYVKVLSFSMDGLYNIKKLLTSLFFKFIIRSPLIER